MQRIAAASLALSLAIFAQVVPVGTRPVDFTVTAGRQYDRTASLYLGNANIFYGTTAEPRSTLSPSWRLKRDVTDLSAIFKTAQAGQAIIYNIYDSTYNNGIHGTAKLLFYPSNFRISFAVVPETVIPVSGANSLYELDTTASQLTTSLTAPRNTVKAYLDVIAQSQSSDESGTCASRTTWLRSSRAAQAPPSAKQRSQATANQPVSRPSFRGFIPVASTPSMGAPRRCAKR